MAAKTIKQRIQHAVEKDEDAETSESDSLTEPLLRKQSCDDSSSKCHSSHHDIHDNRKGKCHCWAYLLSHSISRWARWLANVVLGFGTLMRRSFQVSTTRQEMKNDEISPVLNALQEERLRTLKQRSELPFDASRVDHQHALRELWRLAYPDRVLPSLKSELWKEMGWQGSDPSSDFRAGGFMSLENLIYLAKNYPHSFWRLLYKQEGRRAEWEYPFAVAGVNISYMLMQMLGLQSGNETPRAGSCFLRLLEEDEMAFDEIYCVAFNILDAQWLEKRASYMEFNEVLKSTRAQLEHELTSMGISSIKDLPSYKLLSR